MMVDLWTGATMAGKKALLRQINPSDALAVGERMVRWQRGRSCSPLKVTFGSQAFRNINMLTAAAPRVTAGIIAMTMPAAPPPP